MASSEPTVWGIHAGQAGEADSLFLRESCVAIGWREIGDLSDITPTQDAFLKRVKTNYPQTKPGAFPVIAGVLRRFRHEMKETDIVVYPSKIDKMIHIGRIVSAYKFDDSREPHYPHRRTVMWLSEVRRIMFTQGALYEIGSQVTLFKIRNHTKEILSAIDGKIVSAQTLVDETVRHVAEDIEETTRDFILKTLAKELKGHPLAEFVSHLLNAMGYRTRVSPEGPDGGIDIVAHKDELGFEPPIIKIQVKSSESNVGDPAVTALYGNVSANEYAMVITLGGFTSNARNFARNKSNLRLIDGNELVTLVLEHYDQFDSRYKGLLPMKRVYVPQSLDEDN